MIKLEGTKRVNIGLFLALLTAFVMYSPVVKADFVGYEALTIATYLDPSAGASTKERCFTGVINPLCGGGAPSSGNSPSSAISLAETNSQVFSSADLVTGELKVEAANGSWVLASWKDTVRFNFDSFGVSSDVFTLTLKMKVHGTYSVPTGQTLGQANFFFNAFSGSSSVQDQLNASAAYRTDFGQSSTASPQQFLELTRIGDWVRFGTDLFIGQIDIFRSDPSLHVGMGLSAIGPANFANTATFSMILPANTSFTSDSGVFLSGSPTPPTVPEPTTMALLGMGLAGLGAVRRRRKD